MRHCTISDKRGEALNKTNFDELKAYNYLISEIAILFHEDALRNGLSDTVQNIFYTLLTMGPDCTQSDISRLSGIPKQTIHSAICKLEREGLVYLEGHDAKRKMVRLTPDGQALAQRAVMPLIRAEGAIFSSWSKQDREDLFRLTARYRDDFKENLSKEKPV